MSEWGSLPCSACGRTDDENLDLVDAAEAAIERVRALHVQGADWKGRPQCEECASLCHSREGIMCDEPDGAWPCATIAALDGGTDGTS